MFRSAWHSCLKCIPVVGGFSALMVLTWMSLNAAEEPGPAVLSGPVVPDEADTSSDADDVDSPMSIRMPDRSHYMGARACLDCHRSEYVSWLRTEHYNNSKSEQRFDDGENSVATKYRNLVGDFKLCYTCHSAPREKRFDRAAIETGTSCESCHGASGGDHGWLNRHAVYGPNITSLEQESPQHYADRIAFCDAAGMVRPGLPLAVAKNCYSCHLVTEPTLISDDVGHPTEFPDNFSLIPALAGEVRHNFHLNQRHNAEAPTLDTLRRGQSVEQRKRIYLVVEQFARAEVALDALTGLPGPEDAVIDEDFLDQMKGVFDDAAGLLETYGEILLEPDDDDIEALPEEDVEALLLVVEEFDEFDDLDEPTRADATKTSQNVAALGARFLAEHDGSKLAALDAEIEDIESGFDDDQFGKALEP